MPAMYKYVEGRRARKAKATTLRAQGRERERENGRRTSFGRREVWRDQARPEARLWLRDYLGRQASGRAGAAGERGLWRKMVG